MQLPLRSVCWWLLHMCRWARLIFRIVDSCMASITAIAIQSIQNNSIISQQNFFYTILLRISTHKWNNVLCNCTVVTTVTVIRKMMYCDVTSGLCTYISCVLVDVFIAFESWPVCNIKYKYYMVSEVVAKKQWLFSQSHPHRFPSTDQTSGKGGGGSLSSSAKHLVSPQKANKDKLASLYDGKRSRGHINAEKSLRRQEEKLHQSDC